MFYLIRFTRESRDAEVQFLPLEHPGDPGPAAVQLLDAQGPVDGLDQAVAEVHLVTSEREQVEHEPSPCL